MPRFRQSLLPSLSLSLTLFCIMFITNSLCVTRAFRLSRASNRNSLSVSLSRCLSSSSASASVSSSSSFPPSTSTSGAVGTTEFRIHFHESSVAGPAVTAAKKISPWHDVPLKQGQFFNYINEIPKFSKAKMEVSTKEQFNPISQDVKKGQLRDYHGPIYWNYGCLPQTWEDPNIVHPDIGCKGDNDPLDVVEIGSAVLPTGTITPVKVLGVLAMIDDGELDWKVIAIKSDDPLSSQLNDIEDVESKLPGVVSGVREWFRWYKTPDHKPLNKFGYNEKALNKAKALEVIEETHHYWKELTSHKSEKGKLWIGDK